MYSKLSSLRATFTGHTFLATSSTNYYRKTLSATNANLDPSLNRSTLYKLHCSQIYSVVTLRLNAHHLPSTLKTSPGISVLVKMYKNPKFPNCIARLINSLKIWHLQFLKVSTFKTSIMVSQSHFLSIKSIRT